MGETIKEINAYDAFKQDMQTYAIAINRKQSNPDVKDGQKAVARAILTAYFMSGVSNNHAYVKSARMVGDTIGKYHPHGDSAVYQTLVLRTQPFKTKEPLFDGHGNYGNMQGAGAAAMRYTETRLSKFADECIIGDLYKSKKIVDWVPNFDEKEIMPEYYPVKIPILLVNGTFGIGIGMKSEIPTHNITEVLDATIAVLKNPKAPVVLIPDHCMPCEIINTNWKVISNTGSGKYRVRGKIDIEWYKDIPKLIIKSVPNNVKLFLAKGNSTEGVISKINDFVKTGKLPMISKIDSDSKGNDLRYVITLKRGSDPNYVKEFLYKNTLLENSYSVNFEVLDGIEPRRFSYKSYIEYFIEFSIMLKIRKYAALYKDEKTKWREKQLYIQVMESGWIDQFQSRIRKMTNISKESWNEFKEEIIKKFNVSDLEADFILNMDQRKAAPGYLVQYQQELAEAKAKMDAYFNIMTNDDLIKQEIMDDLQAIKKKFGKPRVCTVIDAAADTIPQGEFKVVVTENNFIKKIAINDTPGTCKGDNPKFVLKTDNTKNVLLFDAMGKVFKVPVHKIPLCAKGAAGTDLKIMIKTCTSNIVSAMYEPTVEAMSKMNTKHFITVLTEGNCIKKMDLDDFLNVPPSGILYTKLNSGDLVKDIAIIPLNLDVIIYSDKKALCFNSNEILHYKRTALGVKAMETKESLDGLSILYPDCTDIIVLTQNGKVNKFNMMGLNRSNRGKAGSSVIKLAAKDKIVGIYGANDGNVLHIVTANGTLDVNVSDIKAGSSISSGEKIVPTKGDVILKACIR